MTTPFPFVAAQVLTASELNSITNLPSSTKTANYVLTIANVGARVVMNAAGSTTITVNTSIFSAGDIVELSNIGAGVCTVTAGTATVSSAGPLAIPQYGGGRLVFTSASAAIYFPSAVTVAAPAAAGLTFIQSGSVSAQTSLTISNCFSATYDNYKLIIANYFTSSAGYNLHLQYGTSTADTTNDYMTGTNGTYDATTTYIRTAQTSATGTGRKGGVSIEIQSPNLAQPTNSQSLSSSFGSATSLGRAFASGQKPTTSQYTSLFLTCETPETFTFDFKIYGYANS